MKTESEPVSDDEWLLRRIRFEQFRPSKSPLVSPKAFRPRTEGREPDRDGISLYRLSCVSDFPEILTFIDPDKRLEYGIVQIPVLLIYSLGMTVSIRPDARISGHVIIPELNDSTLKSELFRLTPIMARLAAIASDPANILLRPSPRVS